MTVLRALPTTEISTLPAPSTSRSEAIEALLTDAQIDRATVLSRVDREQLMTAPFNLLLSAAISCAPQDAAELTEDAVLRQTAALTDEHASIAAHAQLLAETFVLTNVEYQNAILAYTNAESAVPCRGDFNNPQHYLEALKIHERRMDRLLRARKEIFERLQKASEAYREALLTRDGLEVLRTVARQRTNASQSTVGDAVTALQPPPVSAQQGLHLTVTVR
jgi:hypothetical protein